MAHASDLSLAPALRHGVRLSALALLLAVGAQVSAQTAPRAGRVVNAQTADTPASQAGGGNVTLDFANAEIDAVARTMATITGRNVVVDPRVKGTMTLTSTTPVSPGEALRLFSLQLRTQGFALIDSHGMYVVAPEAEAKLQGRVVSAGRAGAASGQIVTQIFRLTHENASSLVPVLRPLISPNNTININPGTNSVIITDYADNLQRLGRIIAALDVANATGVEVVRLRYAVASDLAPLVARLLDANGSASAAAAPAQPQPAPGQAAVANAAVSVNSGDGYRTTIVPEPRSNALILRAANPARLAQAKALIEQLDQPPATQDDGSSSNIHVVYLKNADAAKLAVTLRAALAALPGQSGSQNQNAGGGGASSNNSASSASTPLTQNTSSSGSSSSTSLNSGPSINAAANNQPNTGGQIQADPATNSLIISAPEPVYRELRAVIDQLDQRRAQVYVESLIAEINTNREADLGIQWQTFLGKNGNSTVGFLGSNFGSISTGSNILGLTGAVSQLLTGPPNTSSSSSTSTTSTLTGAPNTGINLGLLHNFGGGYVLGALANFLQSTGTGNVLSTPTLLTLDNEEARIMVGQNVPIITGSYTNTGSSSTSASPFQTMDRQDVGITLRVRPQISEDGSIKLVIYQEVSSVVANTLSNAAGPTTNKRALESSVIVNDGQLIVLGGLLSDEMDESEDKVPWLGDIPVMGNLFKSQNRTHTKNNLMVFLRPVIVRDAASSENLSLSRYDYMRALQQNQNALPPAGNSALRVGAQPTMPAITPVNLPADGHPVPVAPLIPGVPDAAPAPAASQAQPAAMTLPAAGDHSDLSGPPIRLGSP
jgi:general secretion pathway protein D